MIIRWLDSWPKAVFGVDTDGNVIIAGRGCGSEIPPHLSKLQRLHCDALQWLEIAKLVDTIEAYEIKIAPPRFRVGELARVWYEPRVQRARRIENYVGWSAAPLRRWTHSRRSAAATGR